MGKIQIWLDYDLELVMNISSDIRSHIKVVSESFIEISYPKFDSLL